MDLVSIISYLLYLPHNPHQYLSNSLLELLYRKFAHICRSLKRRVHVNLHSCCSSHTHSRSICDSISCIVSVTIPFGIFGRLSATVARISTQKLSQTLRNSIHSALIPLSKHTNNFSLTANIVCLIVLKDEGERGWVSWVG